MSSGDPWSLSRGPRDWPSAAPRLDEHVVEAMRAELPGMAVAVVSAIQHQVEEYADPFRGEMGRTIENAVGLALGGFLTLVSGDEQSREGTYEQVWDAAHGLGRGEARGGRSMDALLRAYRIGARVSWRDMSRAAVAAGLDAGTVAAFAELVFSYIDELSAASAAGHAEELTIAGRLRERLLEQVADALVGGRPPATVIALADRAGWPVPTTITAVLVPEGSADRARSRLPAGTVQASGPGQRTVDDLPAVDTLLVPGPAGVRPVIRRGLRDGAVVGPSVPWDAVPQSVERGLRLLRLHAEGRLADAPGSDAAATEPGWGLLDTDDHLPALVLGADESAHRDLRRQVLAPLAGRRPSSADKLVETLRAWALHQGRREAMAASLFVHPQTVRYRMGQLREAYGDLLEDPDWVLRATLALGLPVHVAPDEA